MQTTLLPRTLQLPPRLQKSTQQGLALKTPAAGPRSPQHTRERPAPCHQSPGGRRPLPSQVCTPPASKPAAVLSAAGGLPASPALIPASPALGTSLESRSLRLVLSACLSPYSLSSTQQPSDPVKCSQIQGRCLPLRGRASILALALLDPSWSGTRPRTLPPQALPLASVLGLFSRCPFPAPLSAQISAP